MGNMLSSIILFKPIFPTKVVDGNDGRSLTAGSPRGYHCQHEDVQFTSDDGFCSECSVVGLRSSVIPSRSYVRGSRRSVSLASARGTKGGARPA